LFNGLFKILIAPILYSLVKTLSAPLTAVNRAITAVSRCFLAYVPFAERLWGIFLATSLGEQLQGLIDSIPTLEEVFMQERRAGLMRKSVTFKKDRPSVLPAMLDTPKGQLGMDEHDLFGEYAEITTQYFLLLAFGPFLPLTALFAFLNTVVEFHLDIFKTSRLTKRPMPSVDTMEVWVKVFSAISFVAGSINIFLLLVFLPDHFLPSSLVIVGRREPIGPCGRVLLAIVLEHFMICMQVLIALSIPHRPVEVQIALDREKRRKHKRA